MSDTPESVRSIAGSLVNDPEPFVQRAFYMLERYAALLEQHIALKAQIVTLTTLAHELSEEREALKARVEECEKYHWVMKPLDVQAMGAQR